MNPPNPPTEAATKPVSAPAAAPSNFIRDIILEDLKTNKYNGLVQTRFPPEPNGYLHIGHAKAICLDFGLADEFGGKTNLRFDDTNPEREEQRTWTSLWRAVGGWGFGGVGFTYGWDSLTHWISGRLKSFRVGKAFVADL